MQYAWYLIRREDSGITEALERVMCNRLELVQTQLKNAEDFQKLLEAWRNYGIL